MTVGIGARAHRRPRRVLWLFLFVAIVVAVWIGFAAADAFRVEAQIRDGKRALHGITTLSASNDMRAVALVAERKFDLAERIAHRSVAIGAWARLPLVGRPARWLRGTTTITASLSRDAAEAIGRIEPGLRSMGGPTGRLGFMQLLDTQLSSLRARVEAVHLPSTGGFLPPVNSADNELRRDLARIDKALTDGVAGVRGVRALLQGPSTYLVLAANNAEMRAGGMVLQAGVIRSAGGTIAAGRFRSTARLVLPSAVPVPPEIQTLYGWLSPGAEWRNAGSSPNFPVTAPIYAAMAQKIGHRAVDGVVQIDVLGIRSLLGVVGPVRVNGRTYDASNVARLVMHDLYARFGEAQIERRHEFSALAAAVFQALNDRPWHFEQLVRALDTAASGRHLLAWSPHPVEQAAWERLGVDGALDRSGLMVTVQNHTGNKLDWFLQPSIAMTIEPAHGGVRRVHLHIAIANPTPPGQPSYIAGDGSLVPPGAYRALVAVYLPGWATDVAMPGARINLVGPDGPMRVIGTRIDIARGATRELEVVFTIPSGMSAIDLLPSARARPVPLTYGARRYDDRTTTVVTF